MPKVKQSADKPLKVNEMKIVRHRYTESPATGIRNSDNEVLGQPGKSAKTDVVCSNKWLTLFAHLKNSMFPSASA